MSDLEICGCGDYTPNKNGVYDTCKMLDEMDELCPHPYVSHFLR
jgi:hypothetical protein